VSALVRVWLLDASALINIKTTVPASKQWGLLKLLERMVEDGSLAFPRQVKDEVTGMLHPDGPGIWADGVFPLMRHPREPDIAYVRQVMSSSAAAVVDPDKTREDGDPYLIALGLQLIADGWDVCLVTDDRIDTPTRIAMSKACDLLDVPWCCLNDFLTEAQSSTS
jgi:hypothetical protein